MSEKQYFEKIEKEANDILLEHKEFCSKEKAFFENNVQKLKKIKKLFHDNFSGLIEEIGHIEQFQKSDVLQEEESPAALEKTVNPVFNNGTYIYKHLKTEYYTFSNHEMLPHVFNVQIRMKNITFEYVVCGVSNKIIDSIAEYGYLGGDMGEGNWGIASNGAIGEEGKWRDESGKTYNTGDILTIKGNNGVITYAINDIFEDYSYDMKTTELYLSFTLYYSENEIEIL